MVEIVRAGEHHISDIGALWLEFIHFHMDIDPIFTPVMGAVQDFEKEEVYRLIESEHGLVLVALDGKRVIGYSISEVKDPPKGFDRNKYGCVHHMAITANHRRKGIGAQMLDEIIKWFHSKYIRRIELEITTKNQVAYSFWEKHGFTDYTRTLFKQI